MSYCVLSHPTSAGITGMWQHTYLTPVTFSQGLVHPKSYSKCYLYIDWVIHTVPEARYISSFVEMRKWKHGNINLSTSTDNYPALKFKPRSPIGNLPKQSHPESVLLRGGWVSLPHAGLQWQTGWGRGSTRCMIDLKKKKRCFYKPSISDSGY